MNSDRQPASLPMVKARMRIIGSLRRTMEQAGFLEVQTPLLHPRLSGFEKGTGFSTFSSALGERLWFRAAPELYLKRMLIDWAALGVDRIFEVARCLRDELDEQSPRESFDKPEVTLLELYSAEADHWSLEDTLRSLIEESVAALRQDGLLSALDADKASERFQGKWQRRTFGDLLQKIDSSFDLEELLTTSSRPATGGPTSGSTASTAELHSQAIDARAADTKLRDAAANLAYQAGGLAPYLRTGPQGYWFEFLEHAFRAKIAPELQGPIIVHGFPLEASPLADSDDGIHCLKWELYVDGVRIALAQRELMDAGAQKIRFQHLERLRRLGYNLLPEPDESFLQALEAWPTDRTLIGMGVYVDRLAGALLGILGSDGKGQERMLPHLYKHY